MSSTEVQSTNLNANLPPDQPLLRWFAVLVCVAIVCLIFFGGQVKSHDAGLAVPDWPMTFGENPITYPISKWQGGIFHEHFHRLLAGTVGMLSLILALWATFSRTFTWVKIMVWVAGVTVLVQAFLGGLTVWLQLPVWTSTAHAILAQTYLALTVIVAYGLSKDYRRRREALNETQDSHGAPLLYKAGLLLIALLFAQLLLGSLTRHTEAALAVPDFPTTGGQAIPRFDEDMLMWINDWRFQNTDARGIPLQDVTMTQVALHFSHRVGAVIVTLMVGLLAGLAYRKEATHPHLFGISLLLCLMVIGQFGLGIVTVLSLRAPVLTSMHVMFGAALMAASVWFALRARPLRGAERREETATAGLHTASST